MPGRSTTRNVWPCLLDRAFFALDRDARPVADVLVGAGQLVEDRGLAGVRVTGEGDHEFASG